MSAFNANKSGLRSPKDKREALARADAAMESGHWDQTNKAEDEPDKKTSKKPVADQGEIAVRRGYSIYPHDEERLDAILDRLVLLRKKLPRKDRMNASRVIRLALATLDNCSDDELVRRYKYWVENSPAI